MAKKKPSSKAGAKHDSGARRYLFLVRHGQYTYEGDWGILGGPLTPKGRRQAACVAKYLTRYPVSKIHTSDLTRARETADIVSERFDGMKPRVSQLLRERRIAPVPGQKWKRTDHRTAQKHFKEVWAHHMKPPRKTTYEVVVCHGNLIRCLTMLALEVKPLESWAKIGTFNCAITTLAVRPDGGCSIIGLNDMGFMPMKLRSSG